MPQPNLESELTAAQVEQIDALVLGGRHSYEEVREFCKSQGWPSRSLGTWTAYKQRAQNRAVVQSISNGTALSKTIRELKKGKTDETVKTLLDLQGHIAMTLAANGTTDPEQLKLAHKLTQLLLEAEGMKGRAAVEKVKLGHKEREIAVTEQKFQRDTCELFLKWFKDRTATEIAENTSLTQPQKIEALGQQMFGELWK